MLLALRERGLVDLHAPVTDYLPWFDAGPHTAEITIHHLLTHSAGITRGSDLAADGRYEVWQLRELPVSGPPGDRFHYSNVGYKILGYIIEEITGDTYGQVIAREIFAPLGMTESFTPITDRERSRLAIGYRAPFRDRPFHGEHPLAPAEWVEAGAGDGSIAGPIGDMLRYTRLLMHRGAGIVGDASFATMIDDLAPRTGLEPEQIYGYGLSTRQSGGRTLLGHDGGMIGYVSSLQIDVDAGLGVFAMMNGSGPVTEIATEALGAVRSSIAGVSPHAFPDVHPRWRIERATELAGEYSGDGGHWRFVAEGDRLWLERPYGRAAVESIRQSSYVILDPTLDRVALVFEFDESGNVVALRHGTRWMARAGSDHPPIEPIPEAWRAFIGEYLNYNPWLQRFSVFKRRGALWCGFGAGHEFELVEIEPCKFRLGDEPTADQIEFLAMAGGQALRADLNGQAYYRTCASSVRSPST